MRSPLSHIIACVALIAAGGASAQTLSDADLLAEITDNTLTGYNGSLWFSEYHAPDGRVFGHNAGSPNRDVCWKVRGDAVCYYYHARDDRLGRDGSAEFCWRFERAGSKGYKIALVGRAEGGVALLERGNARDHTDNGHAWTCEASISRNEGAPSAKVDVAGSRPAQPGRPPLMRP